MILFSPSLEGILEISSYGVTLLYTSEVHEVRRSVYFMIEILRITQHQFVLHVCFMSHTYITE